MHFSESRAISRIEQINEGKKKSSILNNKGNQ